jgi:hypothetical protein
VGAITVVWALRKPFASPNQQNQKWLVINHLFG